MLGKHLEWESDPFYKDILPLVPPCLGEAVAKVARTLDAPVNELRLRAERPVCLITGKGDVLFDGSHPETPCLIPRRDDIERILSIVSDCSFYALEGEFANGYITIKGGHRVGLSGEAALWPDGSVRLRQPSSLSFRVARAFVGSCNGVLPMLTRSDGRLYSTIIISPPGAGKTTMLRDLVRVAGLGCPSLGLRPTQVGIADERSEIAACYGGVPQHDVGPRADVLDRCPKKKGIPMLLRSMGPGVIATDELGGEEDAEAVASAISGGAVVLATCHGEGTGDIARRPHSRWLVDKGYFPKAIVLSRRKGPGTVEFAGDILEGGL